MSGANLELGDGDKEGDANANGDAAKAKIIKPKRNIAKQPLLNADRILGKRGIRVLEKMFEDFEPRGTMLTILLTSNIYICEISYFSYVIFDFRRERIRRFRYCD